MKFWVGVTDNNWFECLAERMPDEVNFWRPKNLNQFRAIDEGGLFLFKLHSPLNYIAGGAFFFSREDWIPVPEDWKGNLVQGRVYESRDSSYGENLWREVQLKMVKNDFIYTQEGAVEETAAYGNMVLVHQRLGQGAFRVTVADAYRRRCAITGENTLFVLEAAHIKPYSQSHSHEVSNGIFLRSDFHALFDQGYISISPDYEVLVSGAIKDQFNNGKMYYARHGKKLISLPERKDWLPDREYLEWHNHESFQGVICRTSKMRCEK